MTATNVYLNFNGNCRQAMSFYGKCLQAEPGFTPFPDAADRIMHSELHSGPLVLMASDVQPGTPFAQGTNFAISISCESQAEMERLFAAFGEGGKVTVAMHDAFWGGRFGMLTDGFGVSWMFSFR